MDVQYLLELADHLAWYDYYLSTSVGISSKSSIAFIARFRRWRFARRIISKANRHALGERTLELNEKGVREHSAEFDFTTAWSEIVVVEATANHLFLSHSSMNAHIVPLRFFESDAKRESVISFAKDRVKETI